MKLDYCCATLEHICNTSSFWSKNHTPGSHCIRFSNCVAHCTSIDDFINWRLNLCQCEEERLTEDASIDHIRPSSSTHLLALPGLVQYNGSFPILSNTTDLHTWHQKNR